MREIGQLKKQATQQVQPIKVDEKLQPLPEAETVVEKKLAVMSVQPSGSHQDWMRQVGIPESDWSAVEYIIAHEGGWRFDATNPTSGAYGICQALPAQKMQSAGLDYRDNPITQLKWCNDYAKDRYGGWQQAYQFWVQNRWW